VPLIDEEGLTELGLSQVMALKQRLANNGEIEPDVVIASSFPRALQTAKVVNELWSLPLVESDEVQEWRPGADTVGLTLDDLMASWNRVRAGDGHDHRLTPLTETHNEFINRVDAALTQIAADHKDQGVAVFTHGGVISRSLVTFLGLPPAAAINAIHADHTSITEWRRQDHNPHAAWLLVRYNDAAHLTWG